MVDKCLIVSTATVCSDFVDSSKNLDQEQVARSFATATCILTIFSISVCVVSLQTLKWDTKDDHHHHVPTMHYGVGINATHQESFEAYLMSFTPQTVCHSIAIWKRHAKLLQWLWSMRKCCLNASKELGWFFTHFKQTNFNFGGSYTDTDICISRNVCNSLMRNLL